ncbi:hypothetical protein EGW08_016761 [Elysia chlorotica]|uniref:Sestrin n=1 Tax=Elysia chlorotica TaxID=188477 RepID=A0A3S0ZC49_ELYCH|nr:hypothetical protein EGW08_016761 [Elysia chlorotica]
MPNFTHHAATLDSKHKQTIDLDLELDHCTECVDNIAIGHSFNHKLIATSQIQNKAQLDHEGSETLNRCGSHYSKSGTIPTTKSNISVYGSPLSESRLGSRSKAGSFQRVHQSPIQAQTCVDSFYTPTNRSSPPIIGMRDLQNREFCEDSISNDTYKHKLNDNDFHFPKSVGIELNGYVPWDSEINDSDCDDGMFDREQQHVEDMHVDVDTDSNDCQAKNAEIVPSYTADDQSHNLFMDAFLQNNRLDSVSQVMGYHPDYLRIFLSTQHFLLREDGPLSYDYRHYIAIMAAARHHCTYLVELHEQDFLRHSGDPEWLKGLEHAPRKLRDLYEINKLLAHQPWLITKEHMLKLLKSPEPWSLSELMHAIILLTHFHSLCSFVFGCGISSAVDSQGERTYLESVLTSTAPTSLSSSALTSPSSSGAITTTTAAGDESDVCVKALMEKMRQMQEAPSGTLSPEERIKQFNMEGQSTAEIAVPNSKQPTSKSEILKYVQDTDFAYNDFATRKCAEVSTFCACDYSWEDHGFSLANRLYTDIGNYLDDKYSTAANMTYYTMGDLREVDTSSFRRAIWNYIHIMYGIRHDDYDYSELNQLLEINLKAYIKTLTCYPERLKKKDFDGVMKGFQHSEKVHVNLMLMEARQQAELLYALRALNSYLT